MARERVQVLALRSRVARLATVLIAMCAVGACRPGDDRPGTASRGKTDAPPPRRSAAQDSAAILDSFARITAAIDRDSARFSHVSLPVSPGAGTSGNLTAWRAGRIWQRIRVDAAGEQFSTRDTYWFNNGALLGVRLELARVGRTPAVDRVWFRNRALYKWTDRDGRSLLPDARSTQYEVAMMRARLDSLLLLLDRDELQRGTR